MISETGQREAEIQRDTCKRSDGYISIFSLTGYDQCQEKVVAKESQSHNSNDFAMDNLVILFGILQVVSSLCDAHCTNHFDVAAIAVHCSELPCFGLRACCQV